MLRAMSRHLFVVSALVLLLVSRWARADVSLPALVSDGMVLQQKVPLRIWGWAPDGEQVEVRLRGQTARAVAQGGQWSVSLSPLDAGGPFDMTIVGRNSIVVRDVLIGEVWLCGGQSNMEFELERSALAQADIAAPADPQLRMFTVGRQLAEAPRADVAGGAWEHASPATRGHFSAVGYYFGRALRSARGVPIGLIHASWGGTPAEAWMSRPALEDWGLTQQAFSALAPPSAAARAEYEQRLEVWKAAGRPQGSFDDPGTLDAAKSWALPATDTHNWRAVSLPLLWERLGAAMQLDGAVWFRKDVVLPPAWAGRDLELHLGAIDDLDTTYFDGRVVGATAQQVPNHWEVRRRYRIPATGVRAGRRSIAVRVWDRGGDGGFTGPVGEMWLAPTGAAEKERISLAGDWRFARERTRPSMPNPPGLHEDLPSVLYNGMIAPLLPYAIKGVVWYQGESNVEHASEYRSLLTALIGNWRAGFPVGSFPFLIVQLAPYRAIAAQPEESDWARLREAQDRVAREVANTGLVVTTDVGDEKDIHPTHKKPIGERLARVARKLAYGQDVAAFGPSFRSAARSGGKLVLSFDNVGQGLVARGGRLTGFAIAGSDGKFVNADAAIVKDQVIVSSPKVAAPSDVRFGWANYPVVNLWNRDGLPATPFRTDQR
jgi:sialate O-acetylesterase